MITRREHEAACERAWELLRASGLALRDADRAGLVAADFGLSRLEAEGAQILTFFATERISAKAIVLFPGQHLPEHRHPPQPRGEGRMPDPGKEEILRVQAGRILVGLPADFDPGGASSLDAGPAGAKPSGGVAGLGGAAAEKPEAYRGRKVVSLGPGEQLALPPGTWHWLAGGGEGGVLLSFSTCVRDLLDEFTDPSVQRQTHVVEEE